MNEDATTRVTVFSQNALLRMLREQGVTDLDDLVTKGLDSAQAAVDDGAVQGPGDVFISAHYVYVHV